MSLVKVAVKTAEDPIQMGDSDRGAESRIGGVLGDGGVECCFAKAGNERKPGRDFEFVVDEECSDTSIDADRRGRNIWGAVGVIVEKVVVLVLGESVHASLNIIAFDVGIERYLGSSVLGGLGYGGNDGKVVRAAVVVGSVVVIEGRNGQQSAWVKGVNP